ncbi:YwmB family TATA-box binding protein [Mobilitalea sibirica]|uniref:YwmB family TATA-box binding protein n=1 Tax=Mobilitalea sibirica TaxID=1462919 RepID=A0A8J7HC78_9FIRM|nr:YwmB family TATA-box binding protein [Mobilitalea sibirica]MBH1940717.1 YwmB family TATA-box binding protein [Mobilitalea sibirica]
MDNKKLKYIYDLVKQTLSLKRTKFTLYIAVVLWLAFATQIIVNRVFHESFQITQAFVKTNAIGQQSSIEIIAECKNDFLSEEDKKLIIHKIADSIGLTIDKDISVSREGARSEYSFEKQAKSANTMIKIVSLEQKQEDAIKINHYIVVRLSILRGMQSIDQYKTVLNKTLDSVGIDQKQVTLQYEGSLNGRLTLNEKDRIANLLVEELKGDIAIKYDEEDLYTVYGYTGLINEFVTSTGSKVNIHIAITYDEKEDKTKVLLATPIINQSW